MKILINKKEISKEQLDVWRYKRLKRAAKMLRYKKLDKNGNIDVSMQKFTEYKINFSYEQMMSRLKKKLAFSTFCMKLAVKLSRKRKVSIVVIRNYDLTACEVSEGINRLMTDGTLETYKINLAAYSEHYALLPNRDGTFEVVETPGNSPLPVRFFISFGNESGLVTQKDNDFPFQSTGVAKLENGAVIGGVRHQFKDIAVGCEARLSVEFPAIMPNFFIKAHQWHLASEFSFWLDYISSLKKEATVL